MTGECPVVGRIVGGSFAAIVVALGLLTLDQLVPILVHFPAFLYMFPPSNGPNPAPSPTIAYCHPNIKPATIPITIPRPANSATDFPVGHYRCENSAVHRCGSQTISANRRVVVRRVVFDPSRVSHGTLGSQLCPCRQALASMRPCRQP